MKAYEVTYDTAGCRYNQEIVIAESREQVSERLAIKDSDFKSGVHYNFSRITDVKEKSFDEVKLKNLSVNELLMILGKHK